MKDKEFKSPLVLKYGITVTTLTLKLYEEDRQSYLVKLLLIELEHLIRGFEKAKINKPNKKGTKITFKKIGG